MSMPTEPQQDRNVEALNADTVQEIRNLARMSKAGNRYATENLGRLIVRNLDVILALHSRPSQPPQNVEAGDAVKGVVEEIEKLKAEQCQETDHDNYHRRCREVLFSDRLRLALSATGDDAMRDLKPELQQGKTVRCGPFQIKASSDNAGDVVRGGDGVALIAAERKRQTEKEGYDTFHDDEHDDGSMAFAAARYALLNVQIEGKSYAVLLADICDDLADLWPWDADDWKPKDHLRNLVRAGALIAAEIDRLQRLSPNPRKTPGDERQG